MDFGQRTHTIEFIKKRRNSCNVGNSEVELDCGINECTVVPETSSKHKKRSHHLKAHYSEPPKRESKRRFFSFLRHPKSPFRGRCGPNAPKERSGRQTYYEFDPYEEDIPQRVIDYNRYFYEYDEPDYPRTNGGKSFKYDPDEDYRYPGNKSCSSRKEKSHRKIDNISISGLPIAIDTSMNKKRMRRYIYDNDQDQKSSTQISEHVDRQIEDLKTIRDELKSLSRTSRVSLVMSEFTGEHHRGGNDRDAVKIFPPPTDDHVRPCTDDGCYMSHKRSKRHHHRIQSVTSASNASANSKNVNSIRGGNCIEDECHVPSVRSNLQNRQEYEPVLLTSASQNQDPSSSCGEEQCYVATVNSNPPDPSKRYKQNYISPISSKSNPGTNDGHYTPSASSIPQYSSKGCQYQSDILLSNPAPNEAYISSNPTSSRIMTLNSENTTNERCQHRGTSAIVTSSPNPPSNQIFMSRHKHSKHRMHTCTDNERSCTCYQNYISCSGSKHRIPYNDKPYDPLYPSKECEPCTFSFGTSTSTWLANQNTPVSRNRSKRCIPVFDYQQYYSTLPSNAQNIQMEYNNPSNPVSNQRHLTQSRSQYRMYPSTTERGNISTGNSISHNLSKMRYQSHPNQLIFSANDGYRVAYNKGGFLNSPVTYNNPTAMSQTTVTDERGNISKGGFQPYRNKLVLSTNDPYQFTYNKAGHLKKPASTSNIAMSTARIPRATLPRRSFSAKSFGMQTDPFDKVYPLNLPNYPPTHLDDTQIETELMGLQNMFSNVKVPIVKLVKEQIIRVEEEMQTTDGIWKYTPSKPSRIAHGHEYAPSSGTTHKYYPLDIEPLERKHHRKTHTICRDKYGRHNRCNEYCLEEEPHVHFSTYFWSLLRGWFWRIAKVALILFLLWCLFAYGVFVGLSYQSGHIYWNMFGDRRILEPETHNENLPPF